MNQITIKELTDLIQKFCEERDWDQFHNPKDLAIGISTEANELLDIFRFQREEDIKNIFADDQRRMHVEEEITDVLFFVLRFAQMNQIDLESALKSKMMKNAKKYSIEKAKGKNLKYTQLNENE